MKKIYSSIVDDRLVDILGDFAYFENKEDAEVFCIRQGDEDCNYLTEINVMNSEEAKAAIMAIPEDLEPIESKPVFSEEDYEKQLFSTINKIEGK